MNNNQDQEREEIAKDLRELVDLTTWQYEVVNRAADALSTQLPLPSREVVAWRDLSTDECRVIFSEWRHAEETAFGLFARFKNAALCRCDAPAQPLSDEQAWKLWTSLPATADMKVALGVFARAIQVMGAPALPADKGAEEPSVDVPEAPASEPNGGTGERSAGSVTVELSELEAEVLDGFAKQQDLSRSAVMRQALRTYQRESVAIPFWQKHALGSLARPSCFKCGSNEHEAAIMHMELPDIYVCTDCVGRSAAIPDEQILVLATEHGDWHDSVWDTGIPQFHTGQPGVLSFARALLDASPTAPQPQTPLALATDITQNTDVRATVGEDVAAMAEIGRLIATQDNRITDAPIFIVQQKRSYVTDPDYNDARYEWRETESGEHNLADPAEAIKLEKEWKESGRVEPTDWKRYPMHDVWEFVTACFTEQGCKDYLRINGHNLKETRIYAEGSFRNEEFRAVRKYLLSLASHSQTSATAKTLVPADALPSNEVIRATDTGGGK